MEVMLRCALPDRPGALSALTGAIAAAGGDIQAIDVVETAEGIALDDLVVVLSGRSHLADVLAGVEALGEVELVHVGPSRGHPGDAVERLAIGLETVLSGAQDPERAVVTLVGGLLRAHDVTVTDPEEAPPETDKRLVMAFGDRRLVVRRDYRFTATERWRAAAMVRVCVAAADARQPSDPASR